MWNPFDDIVPRSTREERDAKAAKARAAADAAAATARKAADKGRAKMLSFGGGDDDDDLDEPLPVAGVRSAHDAAAISASLAAIVLASVVVGSALPFALARAGVDPANAGTSVQVVMDILGCVITCVTCQAVLGSLAGAVGVVAGG